MSIALQQLNAATKEERLHAVGQLLREEREKPTVLPQYANNHIHTTYSFSPYSPSAAVWFARAAGLNTAGLMDHDTIAGAEEFLKAGELLGIAATVGLECRVLLGGTPLAEKRVNNPDQSGIAYMALHGVPHQHIATLQERFTPLRARRNERNEKMIANCNAICAPYDIAFSMEDVISLSQYTNGGTITERHILFTLAKAIVQKLEQGSIAAFLQNELYIPLSAKELDLLQRKDNPYFIYDLLGILKAQLVAQIYVDANEECLHISELRDLAKETSALFCYAYLGDVGLSVTGDKKAQQFEDGYLEMLFDTLQEYGVEAVTYMPSRNTPAQLQRVMSLCKAHDFMEISGEDINSPRQQFICPQLAQPEYRHLIDATWNLIQRERLLSK